VDIQSLHRDWYAWILQGAPKPVFLRQSVAYYVMGAERWRYTSSLDEATLRQCTWFLDSRGGASDVFSSGTLGTGRAGGAPDQYTYDPRDGSGLEIDAEAGVEASSLVDQSLIMALYGKALVYHSAPLVCDTEITGFFRLSAWIAIDRPDTDLYVSVYEVCLDGRAIRLSMDALRARYREGMRKPRLISTMEPLEYTFEQFTFVSRQVRRGHRLRLVIAPMGRLVDAAFAGKNYNGGGIVAEESLNDAHAVTVTLYHDRTYPSALSVPLGQPDIGD
jgi:putative CocE/NonD family hydrolase